MTLKPVRIAVIGAGKLGIRHAEVYSKLPGAELVGVCDIHESRATECAAKCATRAYMDYRELLKSVDAASIVVPSHLHYEISKAFLENHVHVLIEKPITTDLRQADRLLELARKNRLIVQVGHIERFNSGIRAVREAIKKPRFIECHRVGPYDPRVADVGVTLDLMIHDIDIVMDLVQSPIQHVDAVGASILSKNEDISSARIRFKNGCVCSLTASRMMAEAKRTIQIFQNDGYISLDYMTQEAQIFANDGSGFHPRKIDITKSNSLRDELSHFIHCVQTKKRPLVSGKEGREALALALEISHKIRKGR